MKDTTCSRYAVIQEERRSEEEIAMDQLLIAECINLRGDSE